MKPGWKNMRIRPTSGLKASYYLWVGNRGWQISDRLMKALVAREISLPQYANTTQKIIEVLTKGLPGSIQAINGTSLLFDSQGALDLADQADAICAVFSKPVARGNVLDVQGLLRERAWLAKHKIGHRLPKSSSFWKRIYGDSFCQAVTSIEAFSEELGFG